MRKPGPANCNMCRGGATALGRPCRNGCPFHVFEDGTVLSYRYLVVKPSGHPTGFGDVWGHQLHRGRITGPSYAANANFERADKHVYGIDLKAVVRPDN